MKKEYNEAGDGRFEIIAKAKEHLLDATNIETSPNEMKVIDGFLFRCWQMGWLKKYEESKSQTSERTTNETKIYEYAKAKTREQTQCLKCPYWRETCFTNKDTPCKYQTFCDVYEDVAVTLGEATFEIPGVRK